MKRHPNYRTDIPTKQICIMRAHGASMLAIAKKYKISPETVRDRLAESVPVTRQCALLDCGRDFVTRDVRKTYCCRKHAKLAGNRRENGLAVERQECALPECRAAVLGFRGRCSYCCKDHADLDWRRWRKSKIYPRLLAKSPVCLACGEYRVVDEHHVVFYKNKSDKTSKKVYLCPTHHKLIHCGLAVIDSRGYVDLTEGIVADLKRKQPELGQGRRRFRKINGA